MLSAALPQSQGASDAQPQQTDKEIPMKNCPFCAEEIREEAKKCKHCGEWINGSTHPIPVSSLASFDWEIPPEGVELETVLGDFERILLRNSLQMKRGNMTKAAELLNVTMRSFRYRLQKLSLE